MDICNQIHMEQGFYLNLIADAMPLQMIKMVAAYVSQGLLGRTSIPPVAGE